MSPVEGLDECQTLLEGAMGRIIVQMGNIRGFWSHVKSVTLDSQPVVIETARRALRWALADPQGDLYITDRVGLQAYVSNTGNFTDYANERVHAFTDMLDRAAIVFVHSVVDDVLQTTLRAVAEGNYNAFGEKINPRQVAFCDITRLKSVIAIGRELARAYVDSLEFKSIVKKAEILTSVCGSQLKGLPDDYLTYDKHALEDLNAIRIGIVHKGKGVPEDSEVGSMMDSAISIMLHFIAIAAIACEVTIDLRASVQGATGKIVQ